MKNGSLIDCTTDFFSEVPLPLFVPQACDFCFQLGGMELKPGSTKTALVNNLGIQLFL